MKRVIFAFLFAVGSFAFADSQPLPQQLVCSISAFQQFCPPVVGCGQPPAATWQPIGNVPLTITSGPDLDQASANLRVNVSVYGYVFFINAQGHYSRNIDGSNYQPGVDLEITDSRSGWTNANFGTHSRSSVQTVLSHSDPGPGSNRVTQAEVSCSLQ